MDTLDPVNFGIILLLDRSYPLELGLYREVTLYYVLNLEGPLREAPNTV